MKEIPSSPVYLTYKGELGEAMRDYARCVTRLINGNQKPLSMEKEHDKKQQLIKAKIRVLLAHQQLMDDPQDVERADRTIAHLREQIDGTGTG